MGKVIRLRRRIAACRRLDVVNVDVGYLRSPTERDVEMRNHVNLDRECSTRSLKIRRGTNLCWQLSGRRISTGADSPLKLGGGVAGTTN